MPFGFIDQLTAVLGVLLTVGVNCWNCPSSNVTLDGVRLIATAGIKVTVAVSCVDVFPRVVTVMVTVCCVSMLAGAV